MGNTSDAIVEYAPWILTFLGILLIAADGPLPFMDVIGLSLIAYGRALGAAYKLADVAIAIESHFESDPTAATDRVGNTAKPRLPIRLGASNGTRSSRTNNSLYGLGRWCNIHKRIDNCHYLRSPR